MGQEPPLLELRAIDKRFPGVHALDRVDFTLLPGEVHALLGENGAGKSTLMKLIAGLYRPDSGQFLLSGSDAGGLTPDGAERHGIALVHQELCLVPGLTVAENIGLGRLPKTALGLIDWTRAEHEALIALDELGVQVDPRREVRSLEVAEQQLVEIARTLRRQPRILLLDEPTSALSDAERERLFAVIRRLKARGVGIIYISHHLAEVSLVADRVTVMRDGRVVGTILAGEASQERIVQMMVGRRLAEQFPKPQVALGDVVLSVDGLSVGARLRDVSFTVRRGEIVGVFGLMGSGQAELARVLFGLERAGTGSMTVEGRPYRPSGSAEAIRLGMGLISRDRRKSLVPMLASGPNISLPWLARRRPWRPLERERERQAAAHYIGELDIQPPLPQREVLFFSGGNQQKIILSRWMSTGSRILIFDEPTRGIDVGAKADVFALMGKLAEDGAAILMISSEPLELAGMADRVLVLRDHTVVEDIPRSALTHEALLHAASTGLSAAGVPGSADLVRTENEHDG
jgi:ribose transport system ATP-binding protein